MRPPEPRSARACPRSTTPGLPDDAADAGPETAKSYEIGVKTTFGTRLQHQCIGVPARLQGPADPPLKVCSTGTRLALVRSTRPRWRSTGTSIRGSAVSKWKLLHNPIEGLPFGANVSYSQIKSRAAWFRPIRATARPPCRSPLRTSRGTPINFCPSAAGQVLNTAGAVPGDGQWQLRGADHRLDGGYFRFNVNYQGKNPNFGNFRQPACSRHAVLCDPRSVCRCGRGRGHVGSRLLRQERVRQAGRAGRVTPLNISLSAPIRLHLVAMTSRAQIAAARTGRDAARSLRFTLRA